MASPPLIISTPIGYGPGAAVLFRPSAPECAPISSGRDSSEKTHLP